MGYETDGLGSLSLAIGIVVALLWGAIWALRRMRPNGAIWGGADCAILRSLALGPRERIVIVRVGGKQLVVGVGSAAISLLCELDEPLPVIPPSNAKFGAVVRKAMEQWHGR